MSCNAVSSNVGSESMTSLLQPFPYPRSVPYALPPFMPVERPLHSMNITTKLTNSIIHSLINYSYREIGEEEMGIITSKCHSKNYATPMQLKAKIQALEEEIKQLKAAREREAGVYVERKIAFDAKEEEWRRERKRHKERRWVPGNEYMVEQMEEVQARREAAVDKWKQLYHAIKTELDDLILWTRQGGGVFFGAEEGMIEGLRRELKVKEEAVEALRLRISAMEKEGIKKDREIDILKQSIRILSNPKRNGAKKNLRRRFLS